MAATSLKLPEELKRRLTRLAGKAGQTTHAYMIEALAREVERAELRAQFAADAAESERESLATGKAYSLDATFKYLRGRVAGKRVRTPKPHSWRGSK